MKIKLTQGKVALIDREDFERISQNKWYAVYDKKRRSSTWRAVRYIQKDNKKKTTIMSREIMNFPENLQIDHVNHNSLDNRRKNLRVCTNAENLRNRKSAVKGSTSKYLGVSFCKQTRKWKSRIVDLFGNDCWLGRHVVEKNAAIVRDAAAIKYHGEFVSLNFKR